jgi:hypothetical protein
VIDFTGGAVKRKGKKNIFDDVIARRKDEGNYLAVFLPFYKRSASNSPYRWVRMAMAGLTVVVGLGMLLLFHLLPRGKGAEAGSLPDEEGGGKTPRVVGGAQPGAPESGAPRKRPVKTVVDRGKIPFRPPLPSFEPLRTMNAETLDEVWDDDRVLRNTPWIANNIKAENLVVDHIYRYLRTYTHEELAAKSDPDLSHRDMMTSPGYYRGKVITMRAVVLRVYKIFGWHDPADKESKVPKSGVLDTTMLFVRSADRRSTHIYVVLVPERPGKFRERDVYEFTGVFMKRYPYLRKDNKWETHPLLLTTAMRPAKVTPQDSFHLTVAIVAVAAIAMIVLYFAVRGETRESEEKRTERLERRRQNRDRLKQQIESARLGAGEAQNGDATSGEGDSGDGGGDSA